MLELPPFTFMQNAFATDHNSNYTRTFLDRDPFTRSAISCPSREPFLDTWSSGRDQCHDPLCSCFSGASIARWMRGKCKVQCFRCGIVAEDYGRASKTLLKGVWVALLNCLKPPPVAISCSFESAAWAPTASPTSCEREEGTQIIDEAL